MEKDKPNKDNINPFARQRAEKFSRVYLLLLLLLVSVLFFNVIKIFLVTILLAAVFTALFYPLYEKFLKIFRNSRGTSAILCCLVLLLGLMVPVYIIADLVSGEAIDLYKTAEPKISEIINKGDEGFLGTIKSYPIVKQFNLDTIDWQSSLQDIAKNMANMIGKVINKTSKGTFHVLTDLFITLFIMFYFFRDGDKLINRIKYLSPLDDRHEEVLMQRFVSVSRATITGTLLIGLVQGTLGGLTLWIFGVASPILWGGSHGHSLHHSTGGRLACFVPRRNYSAYPGKYLARNCDYDCCCCSSFKRRHIIKTKAGGTGCRHA